jgi:hypothetical protein
MTRRVGVVTKLYPKDRPGTKRVKGMVVMDGTKTPIEFTGILSLTKRDLNKTKIFGTIISSQRSGTKLIRAKRF